MKQNICESSRLVAFLKDELAENDISDLMEHLDSCSACAQELERMAATPQRWSEAKSHLSVTTSWEAGVTPIDNDQVTLPFSIRQVVNLLDPTDDPNSMGRMGSYEVVGVVGSGAMGVVLKAVDQTLDRIVALKVMNPTLAACGTARYRFAREAKAAAGVLHPNVIAIHGVSTDRELPYLVMPYIAGTSLQQRMDKQGPLEVVEVLRIGSQIAAGLSAAHQKGLIHRDIKPSNIMLDEGVETALITDFGLARTIDDATMTHSGAITGTPEYMSPEQARGDTVDCASDVFSLGSLLYALCSGNRPFRAKTSFGVLRRITDDQPAPIRESNPKIPIWLCELIEKMHAKSPHVRPSSIKVHELLEACLAHTYQPDRIPLPESLAEPNAIKDFSIPKPYLIGVCSVMAVVLFAIFIATLQTGNPIDPGENLMTVKSSSEQDTENQPTVFKTINLNFPKPTKKGALEIDINRGFIEVVGHSQSNVVIEILTPPRFEKSNEQGSTLSEVFAPKYDLDQVPSKNLIKLDTYNQDFVLNLRIKVPQKTDLSLDTYMDGYIEVKNVNGKIKSRTEHSDISLLNIAGSATAYSRNGILKIQFRKVDDDAKLDFYAYNGSIDLMLPATIGATTAVSTGRGSYQTEFKIESIENDERPESILAKIKRNVADYQFGKINGGGIPLRIEGEKGLVRIRKTPEPMP